MAHLSRWRFASKAALVHLGISVLIAAVVAWLVFKVWYPFPYNHLTGGLGLFTIVVLVDLVCGPLVTFILANPRKSKRELTLDFSLVALIQLSALLYGLHTVKIARPVLLSFERDRIAVITEAEIDLENLHEAPANLRQLPLLGQQKIGIRRAQNEKEFFESIHLSQEGMEPSVRPGWWLEFSEVLPEVKEKMYSLKDVKPLRSTEQEILNDAVQRSHLPRESLFYLPMTSKLSQDWLILLDKNGDFVGYAPINGFDLQEGKYDLP